MTPRSCTSRLPGHSRIGATRLGSTAEALPHTGRVNVAALEDEIKAEERIRELEAACVTLQRQLSKAKGKTSDLVEAVERAAKDAAIVTGIPKAAAPPKKRKASKHDDEVCLVHLTDWQLGKVSESYSTEVCIERIRTVVERVRRITRVQRADHPVRHCVVMLGGDHVEGNGIFPGQTHEVDSTSYAQLFAATNLMVETILSLLEDFETVEVYSVPGNHGRLGRKGDEARETNLDNIAYGFARMQLANQSRLVWHDHGHWYQHVVIGKYQALLVHGDQVKSFGGTPAFAIARKATAWSSGAIPVSFTDLFIGHFHQNLVVTLPNSGQVRMTPATESNSQYASEFMASKGRPGQRCLFVHPERGVVTGEYMIWLD